MREQARITLIKVTNILFAALLVILIIALETDNKQLGVVTAIAGSMFILVALIVFPEIMSYDTTNEPRGPRGVPRATAGKQWKTQATRGSPGYNKRHGRNYFTDTAADSGARNDQEAEEIQDRNSVRERSAHTGAAAR